MSVKSSQEATLCLLYAKQPESAGDSFIEIRRWEVPEQERIELIVEHGWLDEDGELTTSCTVMPFYLTVSEVLATITSKVKRDIELSMILFRFKRRSSNE